MEALTCRLLPYAVADGPYNMAADEVLLMSAAEGRASLRFYGWSEVTVSIGYFQRYEAPAEDPLLGGLPFVRRPTGGETLVHHHELTYCLAVPAGRPWQSGAPWLKMHAAIAAALAGFDIDVQTYVYPGADYFMGYLCFRHFTDGDLLIGDTKVVGSAQRKRRGAVMQHGGILLAQCPVTPMLPGIHELTGRKLRIPTLRNAIVRELGRQTGWQLRPGRWSKAETRLAEELAADKYASDAWNFKR